MSDISTPPPPSATPRPAPAAPLTRFFRRIRARRVAAWIGIGLAGTLLTAVLALAGILLWARTDAGERFLRQSAIEAVRGADLTLRLDSLRGPLPGQLTLTGVELGDADGVWLRLDQVRLELDLAALLRWRVVVRELAIGEGALTRLPRLPEPAASPEPPAESDPLAFTRLPRWLPGVQIDALRVRQLAVAPAVLGLASGPPLMFSLAGELGSPGTSVADGVDSALRVLRAWPDGAPDALDVRATLLPGDASRLALRLDLRERAGGVLGQLAGVSGTADLKLTLEGNAPLRDWQGALRLEAWRLARADGTLALTLPCGGEKGLTLQAGLIPGADLPQAARVLLGERTELALSAAISRGVVRLPLLRVIAPAFCLSAADVALRAPDKQQSPTLAGALTVELSKPGALAALAELPFAGARASLDLGGTLDAPVLRLAARVEGVRNGEKPKDAPYPNLFADVALRVADWKEVALKGEIGCEHSLGVAGRTVRTTLDATVARAGEGVLVKGFEAVSELYRATASGEWNPALPFPHVRADVRVDLPKLHELCALFGLPGPSAGALSATARLLPETSLRNPVNAAAAARTPLSGLVDVRLSGAVWPEALAAVEALLGSEARLRADLRGVAPSASAAAPAGDKSAPQAKGTKAAKRVKAPKGQAASPKPAGGSATVESELEISNLRLTSAGLSGTGQARVLGEGRSLEAALDLALKDVAALAPELSGALAAKVRAGGSFASPTLDVLLNSARLLIRGEALERPALHVQATGQLGTMPRGAAALTFEAGARFGDMRLRANAALRDKVISLPELEGVLAGIALSGQGTARLGAGLPRLDGTFSANVRDWAALAAFAGPLAAREAAVALRLDTDPRGRQQARAEWTLADLVYGGNVRLAALRGTAEATDLFGALSARLTAQMGAGRASGMGWDTGELDGSWAPGAAELRARVTGDLSLEAQAKLRGDTLSVDTLSAGLASRQIKATLGAPVTVRGIGGNTLTASEAVFTLLPAGELRLGGVYGPASRLSARLGALPLELVSALSGVGLPEGVINAEATLSGALSTPAVQFSVHLDQISAGRGAPVGLSVTGELPPGGRQLTLRLDTSGLGGQGLTGTAGIPVLYADGPRPALHAPLNGQIRWAGPLAPLWNFVPLADSRLTGEGRLDVRLGGTLSAPRPTGELHLRDVDFADLRNGVQLIDMDADVSMTPAGLVSFALKGKDGLKGTLALDGTVQTLRAGLPLSIKLAVDNLVPLRRADVRVNLSGAITAEGPALTPAVNGEITVNNGELRVDRLPGGGFTTLEVEVQDETAAPTKVEPASVKAEPAPAKTGPAPAPQAARKHPGRLNVRVLIPKRFYIRGLGVESEWQGDLRVRGLLDNPAIRGSFTSVRGVIDLLGKTFTLDHGDVTFVGSRPPQPMLNVAVQHKTATLTAQALISGPASKPRLTLTSQPPLPEDEVLSQMLFGRSPSDLSYVEALQLAAAAASLANLGGGTSITDLTRNTLGMDVFRIGGSRFQDSTSKGAGNPLAGPSADAAGDEGDASSTTLEMGKYVMDNVYVGVQQGVGESSTEVFMDIELSPRLNFEARTSDDSSSVGMNWNWDY